MSIVRRLSVLILLLVVIGSLAAPWLAPHPYDRQFREFADALPSRQFPLGTDDLGRDRLSRLFYATAVSVLLAPAAALTSCLIALGFSLAAPVRSAILQYSLSTLNTLTLSIPWIFPFIVLRAMLPLNTNPAISIVLTFALIGVAGWAYPGRVFAASLREIAISDWILLARASGISPWRVFSKQVLPHLQAISIAQFRILIPGYILSEASLGLLGLGVAEPLPSWGNMLLELQYPEHIRANPAILAPLGLLMLVMICLELLGNTPERVA